MITELSSRANSREINGLASNFISIVEKSGTSDALLLKLIASLKVSNGALSVALDRKLGSDKTEIVWQFEGRRDSGLKSFFLTIEGCTFRLLPEIAAAGKLILEVINRHGRTMYDLPHLEQTSKMDSLFTELTQPALAAALQTTQTVVIVNEVKAANQAFLDELDARTNEAATKEEVQLVGSTRKPVRVGMQKIMNYLGSIVPSVETPELDVIYTALLQVIAEANSNVKARITRKENEKKDGEQK